ncbi:hypothetical protein GGF43_001017 [Coemansia sp. RSA 2618]|nr:hypothetical protein GGF43_001017 [Coemansia sp. RSA 2618]
MSALEAPQSFVTAHGTQLRRNGQPYVVRGANYWQAMNLGASSGTDSDRARVLHDLQTLRASGINMIRILAASEGSQFGREPDRTYPVLMPAPGCYDEAVFEGLDWVLAQLPRLQMTATVSLGNYWSWSGGAAQYVSWATDTRIPYPRQWDQRNTEYTDGSYAGFLAYASRFYADPSIYNATQGWYRGHVRRVVTRRNTVTGTVYADDPSIMAWELMNEPQATGDGERLRAWIHESARFIHALDQRHLVTTGAESKDGHAWYTRMHASPYITLASCHFWALNWGYYNSSDPTDASVDASIREMRAFVGDNARWARGLGKPSVLFEFGLMRDNWGEWGGFAAFDPRAPVTHRDRFFAAVYEEVGRLLGEGVCGAAFWAYAGAARPPPIGDPRATWTGDPPHEPPGWNSIYDADATTLDIIRRSF